MTSPPSAFGRSRFAAQPRAIPAVPGRQTVAPGEVIASEWGNAAWDQGVQRFADMTALDAQWPDPPDGAHAYLVSPGGWVEHHGGAWRQSTGALNVSGGVQSGPAAPFGTSFRIEAGTFYVTTNAAGGFGYGFGQPGPLGTVIVLAQPAEDQAAWVAIQGADRLGFSGVFYTAMNQPAVSVGVRVQFLAVIY